MVEQLVSNMWRLEEGESVTGLDSLGKEQTLQGPSVVRVHEFDGYDFLYVQGDQKSKFLALILPKQL